MKIENFSKNDLIGLVKRNLEESKSQTLTESADIQRVLNPADADAFAQHEEALKQNAERKDPENYDKEVKEVIEETASEESRYRHFDVVDRKDLAKRINEAKEKGEQFKVSRSDKIGFRYSLDILNESLENKEELVEKKVAPALSDKLEDNVQRFRDFVSASEDKKKGLANVMHVINAILRDDVTRAKKIVSDLIAANDINKDELKNIATDTYSLLEDLTGEVIKYRVTYYDKDDNYTSFDIEVAVDDDDTSTGLINKILEKSDEIKRIDAIDYLSSSFDEEELNESTTIDDIDAKNDDKVEKAEAELAKAKDDADADKDEDKEALLNEADEDEEITTYAEDDEEVVAPIYSTIPDDFQPSAKAADLWKELEKAGKIEILDASLEMIYPEGISKIDLDNLLYTDPDFVKELVDLNGVDEEEIDLDAEPVVDEDDEWVDYEDVDLDEPLDIEDAPVEEDEEDVDVFGDYDEDNEVVELTKKDFEEESAEDEEEIEEACEKKDLKEEKLSDKIMRELGLNEDFDDDAIEEDEDLIFDEQYIEDPIFTAEDAKDIAVDAATELSDADEETITDVVVDKVADAVEAKVNAEKDAEQVEIESETVIDESLDDTSVIKMDGVDVKVDNVEIEKADTDLECSAEPEACVVVCDEPACEEENIEPIIVDDTDAEDLLKPAAEEIVTVEEPLEEKKEEEVKEDITIEDGPDAANDDMIEAIADGFVKNNYKEQGDLTEEKDVVKEAVKEAVEKDDEVVAIDDNMVDEMLGAPKKEDK